MPVTIPQTSAELEEIIADDTQREEIFGDPETLKQFLTNYAKAQNKSGELAKQIAEQAAEESAALVTNWLKENGVGERPDMSELVDGVANRIVRKQRTTENVLYNPEAPGAALDGKFVNLADFMKTIWHGNKSQAADEARHEILNTYSEAVPSDGGFLVPEEFRANLLRIAHENAVVRPRATVVPMGSKTVKFPAVDETSRASSLFGGIVTYWTEEEGTLTASSAKFQSIELEALKLTAYSLASNELIADSAISFEAFINTAFPEAINFEEDYQFLRGNGAGTPLGVFNSNAVIAVSKQSGQAATTIVWENLVNMYARMLPSSLNRAVWVASIDTFPELATMALSVGTGGSAIWLNNGVSGPPMTILGRPLILTEKAQTLGTQGDISFIDFGFYLIGDRQAMSARSSEHVAFTTDQTAFRIISRVDGRPWLSSAVTPKNSGSTLSPFVQLETRS